MARIIGLMVWLPVLVIGTVCGAVAVALGAALWMVLVQPFLLLWQVRDAGFFHPQKKTGYE